MVKVADYIAATRAIFQLEMLFLYVLHHLAVYVESIYMRGIRILAAREITLQLLLQLLPIHLDDIRTYLLVLHE